MNYYTINDTMTQELKLKGNKLLIYAVIDTYSHNGGGHFTGSRGYLARITGCTLKSVDNVLKELLDEQLIIKNVLIKKGTTEKYIAYQTTYRCKDISKDIESIKAYLLATMTTVERDLWFSNYTLEQNNYILTVRTKYKLADTQKHVLNRQLEFWNIQHKTNFELEILDGTLWG